jgi:hypothetical protein
MTRILRRETKWALSKVGQLGMLAMMIGKRLFINSYLQLPKTYLMGIVLVRKDLHLRTPG